MRADAPLKRQSFLGQAVLILLPVVVLMVVGLLSLRQDRLLAEQEAKEAAASLARRLAQSLTDEPPRKLVDYLDANCNFHLHQELTLGLLNDGTGYPDEDGWNRTGAWRQANPTIDLSQQPSVICAISPQADFSSPAAYASSPLPPAWFQNLSPEQRREWEQEEQTEFASHDPAAALAAITNFFATYPVVSLPKGARETVKLQELLLETRAFPPSKAVLRLVMSDLSTSDQLTEAGLPVSQLVDYAALRLCPDHAGLPTRLVRNLAWTLDLQPSILSPRLVAEVERAEGPEMATPYGDAAALKAWWEADERARQILADFQNQHPPEDWTNTLYWLTSAGRNYLLVLGNQGTNPEPGEILFGFPKHLARPANFYGQEPASSRPPSIPAAPPPGTYRVLIFPQLVVDLALNAAMTRADTSAPPYAVVILEIGGRELAWHGDRFVTATNTSALPLLGEASGTLNDLPMNTKAYPIRVQVLLADRSALYARQQKRTLLFGGLILTSAIAALAGLLAAHRAFRRQQELSELKSNFVSSVSHELRSPVAAVRLMAENLESGKIPEPQRQREYFRFIAQECRRLSSLIENVLDFSRIEQGRKLYDFEPANLTMLTQTTVKLMEPYALEKGVTLKLEAEAGLEATVDARALQQALVNLLDNAIKHSAKGETVTVGLAIKGQTAAPDFQRSRARQPNIAQASPPADSRTVPGACSPEDVVAAGTPPQPAGEDACATSRTSTIHLFVADDGPGIPLAEQEKIFERFYRLGSELRRETQGIGIGLSIVKHIVEAHGGRVTVASEPGHGSRFTIELPVRRPHE